jgi:hypothetical protein
MEIPLALLIAGVGLFLFIQGNPLSYMVFSIIVFIRPELVILSSLVFIYALISKKNPVKQIIVFGGLGLIPLIVYDLYFFNTIIPNTIKAKSVIYEVDMIDGTLSYICTLLACDRMIQIGNILGISNLLLVGFWLINLFVLIFYILQGQSKLIMEHFVNSDDILDGVRIIVMIWGIFTTFLYIFSKAMVFQWYIPLYTIPFLFSLMNHIGCSEPGGKRNLIILHSSTIVIIHVLVLPVTSLGVIHSPRYYDEFLTGARVRNYLTISNYLNTLYPDSELMTSEIGGIGYGFDGYVYDGAGLVSPNALRYHPTGFSDETGVEINGAIPLRFIQSHQPDIIVGYDVFVESFISSDEINKYTRLKCPLFLSEDLELIDIDTFWYSKYLNIFIRNDLMKNGTLTENPFEEIDCDLDNSS